MKLTTQFSEIMIHTPNGHTPALNVPKIDIIYGHSEPFEMDQINSKAKEKITTFFSKFMIQ